MSGKKVQILSSKMESNSSNEVSRQNPSSWFEPLYARAKGDLNKVP